MDLYNHLVTEVLMSEVSTKGFREFEKKYLSQADRKDLFVQFTKFAGNVEDKRLVGQQTGVTPSPEVPANRGWQSKRQQAETRLIAPDLTLWTTPNHKDPTAVYTYPIEYVLHHPTAIPYGAQSQYLRVIKLRGGSKTLDLQTVTAPIAYDLLRKMGIMTGDKAKDDDIWADGGDQSLRKYSGSAITTPKIFFLLAQSKNADGSGTADNNTQRKRFLKAGIQVVMDTAKTEAAAVIHSNEPEQCFFMDRAAFDVVDVFEVNTIRGKNQEYPEVGHSMRDDWGHTMPKIGSKILSYLDPKDAIVSSKMIRGGIQSYTDPLPMSGVVDLRAPYLIQTKRGRIIGVEHSLQNKEPDADAPTHRRSGRHLPYGYEISLQSETGVVDDVIGRDEELDTAARRIAAVARKKERDPEWRPIRGVPELAEKWRELLGQFPGTTKAGRHYKIDLDGVLSGAGMVCERLAALFSTIGWKWKIPNDPWEQAACWIVANSFYHEVMTRDPGYEDGIKIIRKKADQILDSDPYESAEKTITKFKGTPVEHAATMLVHASNNGIAKSGIESLVSLIHNFEMMYHKRWAVMIEGAYANFSDDIGTKLPSLISKCQKDEYEHILKKIWDEAKGREGQWTQKQDFFSNTGEHPETWGFKSSVNEVIIGTKFSVDTPNSGQSGGSMPTVWKDPSKEASFSAPSKKGTPNPVMAKAKADVEKVLKRHLTWIRDGGSGSETAYIGHGRKVRIGFRNFSAGPMVIPLRADRMPANLKDLL